MEFNKINGMNVKLLAVLSDTKEKKKRKERLKPQTKQKQNLEHQPIRWSKEQTVFL